MRILLVLMLFSIGLMTTMRRFVNDVGGDKNAEAVGRLKALTVLLGTYRVLYGHYPTQEQGLEKVMEATAKRNPEKAARNLKDSWGRPFHYRIPGEHNPDSYDLWSSGDDGIEGTADDIGNWEKPAAPPKND